MEARQVLEKFNIKFEEGGDWLKLSCPFHVESTGPSAAVSSSTGLFQCFSCKHTGDVYDAVAALTRQPRAVVMAQCNPAGGGADVVEADERIEPDVIERWHQRLLTDQKMLAELRRRKGVTEATIKKRRLGLNINRVCIPVYAADGALLNVRQWSPTDASAKMINLRGHGKPRLYPIDALQHDEVIIVEGELKALCLEERGFYACSSTSGAGSWKAEWGEHFSGKNVIIIFDVDSAGQGPKGAPRVCWSVIRHARSLKNIVLPVDAAKYPTCGVDDWLTGNKCDRAHSAAELRELIAAAPPWQVPGRVERPPDDETLYPVTLSQSSRAEHSNKFVEVECVVSAKDTAPYLVPRTFEVHCGRDQEACVVCALRDAKGCGKEEICPVKDQTAAANPPQVSEPPTPTNPAA